MVREQPDALLHQLKEGTGFLRVGQVVADLPPRDVVGRCQNAQVRGRILPHQAVAVADPGGQPEARRQPLIQVADEDSGLFGGDVIGAVVGHDFVPVVGLVTQGDQVAADGVLAAGEGKAHAGGFQRGTAGVAVSRVIAHGGQVGHIAARRHTGGNGAGHAAKAFCRQPVHDRFVGGLHGGFSSQLWYRRIRHAVTEQNQGSHLSSYSFSHYSKVKIVRQEKSENNFMYFS